MEKITELLIESAVLAGGLNGCMDCPPDCFDRVSLRRPSMMEQGKPRIEQLLGEMGLDFSRVEEEVRKTRPGFTLRGTWGFGVCLTPLEFIEAVQGIIP